MKGVFLHGVTAKPGLSCSSFLPEQFLSSILIEYQVNKVILDVKSYAALKLVQLNRSFAVCMHHQLMPAWVSAVSWGDGGGTGKFEAGSATQQGFALPHR